MSSNSQSALSAKAPNTSKPAGLSNQSSPAHSSQTNTFFATEGLNQRRSGGFSSLSSASTAKSLSSPRNIQSAKAKHKQSKRFRLADEDAVAESAAMHSTTSRKGQTSITHLLNFSQPRPQLLNQTRHGSNRPQRNRTWGSSASARCSVRRPGINCSRPKRSSRLS